MKLKEYFEPFINYKKVTCKNPKTVIDYQRNLKYFTAIGEKEITELKKNDDMLVRMEAKGHGKRGEEIAICVLRTLFRFLENEGITIPFKWETIKIPYADHVEQYYLTETDFEEFVDKLNVNKFYELRDRVLYELLWSTGCRISEALEIDMKDINFEKKEIFVHTKKRGWGNIVYISDRLEYWIKRYLERKPEDEALFVNSLAGDSNGRLVHGMARKRIGDYRKRFGVKFDLTHHSARRGFATHLFANKVELKQVQVFGRWKSERTLLKHYAGYSKLQVKNVHHEVYNRAPKTGMAGVVVNLLKKNSENID